MQLVNGLVGIGTGFSSCIPQYNPLEIVENVKRKINSQPYKEMNPWFRNFEGSILKQDSKTYLSFKVLQYFVLAVVVHV